MSSKPKKRRDKKYVPREVCNPINDVFGGMSGVHAEHLQTVLLKNSLAFQEIVQGRGTRDSWDRIIGCVNMANILCEMGVGDEFRHLTIAARDVMCEVGKRYFKIGKFVFTGEELKTMNAAYAAHEAQLENIRSIDLERAANEVLRRIRHGINSTNVRSEAQKDALRVTEAAQ